MKENKLSPPPRHLKPGTARSSPPPEWNVPGGLCRVADLGTAACGSSQLMGRPSQRPESDEETERHSWSERLIPTRTHLEVTGWSGQEITKQSLGPPHWSVSYTPCCRQLWLSFSVTASLPPTQHLQCVPDIIANCSCLPILCIRPLQMTAPS